MGHSGEFMLLSSRILKSNGSDSFQAVAG